MGDLNIVGGETVNVVGDDGLQIVGGDSVNVVGGDNVHVVGGEGLNIVDGGVHVVEGNEPIWVGCEGNMVQYDHGQIGDGGALSAVDNGGVSVVDGPPGYCARSEK